MQRHFLSRFLIMLLLLALPLAAIACGNDDDDDNGGDATPGEQQGDSTIVVGLTSEPTNLNPVFLDINAGNWKTFSGLVKFDQDLNLVPDLAEEMPEVSDDGRTVTVQLRSDVTFHDGELLTAEDVVFTWESILNPDIATPLRDRFALGDLVQDVQAVDEHTVEFTLSHRDAGFLERLYVGIVPQHLLEDVDMNEASFNREPVGTGPYRFVEWRAGERLVFEAYDEYYEGAPNIERIVFTFAPDDNARAGLLESGNIDFARMPPRLAQTFEGNDNLQVIEMTSASIHQLTLPATNPVLADARVRRALSMAIDRQAMVDSILGGAGGPAYGPFIEGHWAYNPDVEVAYDPGAARALLEEAGWTDEDGDGFVEQDGERLAFTLMYLGNISEDGEFALALRSYFAEIGVDLNLDAVSSPGYEDRLDQDAFLHGVGLPYDPEYTLRSRLHSDYAGTGVNPANMDNPDVDAALDAGRDATDRESRTEAYQELQRALVEDGGYLYIAQRPISVVASARISGFEPQMMASPHAFVRGLAWNVEDWELD